MSFTVDVAKFAKKTNSNLDEACRAIKINLFSGVIMDTRVDTGRLRGNWQTSTGNPNLSEVERLDPTGNQSTSEVTNTVKGDTIDYLTNNLPYAEHWEEQDGMIAKNLVRINRTVSEAIKQL